MKSQLTPPFRAMIAALPEHARRQARDAYWLFAENPYHPSLHSKQIRQERPTPSVRIGAHYRALGYFREGAIVWVWVGMHADYDRLLARR